MVETQVLLYLQMHQELVELVELVEYSQEEVLLEAVMVQTD
jgi:hypothetical protein